MKQLITILLALFITSSSHAQGCDNEDPSFATTTNLKITNISVEPTAFMNGRTQFNYDAVTVRMQVNTSEPGLPMLGIYAVYKILSGDLSLPYSVN